MSETVFRLDLNTRLQSKSRDELFVDYDKRESANESARRGFEVHVYHVTNVTQGSEYDCKLWRSPVDGCPMGSCNCEARVICKHLIKTIFIHIERMTVRRTVERVANHKAVRTLLQERRRSLHA